MAFKMKRKGFPMKGESPNKVRDYSSAVKQEDIELKNLSDIDDKELRMEEAERRDKQARQIIADNPGMFEKVEYPDKPGAPGEGIYTNKETGETMKEYMKRIFREGQRKKDADSGDAGEYKDLASIKRTNLDQGIKMKEESPNKALDIGVTRDGEEIMYDMDYGTETGQTRNKKVQDAVKKYEMENQKIVERNEEKASAELDKLLDEQFAIFDNPDSDPDGKRLNEISARQKAIREGDFEGGEKIYDIKYSGEDAKQRDLLDRGKYTYERGKQAIPYDANLDFDLKDEYGMSTTYAPSRDYNPETERTYTDAELRERRKKRKEAADSPAEMKSGFKMKGSPYQMGKMQTAAAVKMAKEAMAKMKKEKLDQAVSGADMEKRTRSAAPKMKGGAPKKSPNPDFPTSPNMMKAKPDYPDIDGDGNTTESMKQAAADKKAGPNKLKRATKEERARMAKDDKKMTPEMMKALKKRDKEMKGKTPGTGMRKMSAADRKELENLGKKSGTKMKKEDSPNKLKKPTRKKEDRPDPTYEGTDEFRKEKDIPKSEFEKRGLKKPAKRKGFPMKKEDSPNKKYKSEAQRKAVHASKADGGKGNPNKMKKKNG